MQKEMNVNIDQAGKQSAVAEIGDLGPGRMLYARAHFDNALTPNQDLSRTDQFAAVHVDEMRSMQHHGLRIDVLASGTGCHQER
jgi:hypothetical protein